MGLSVININDCLGKMKNYALKPSSSLLWPNS